MLDILLDSLLDSLKVFPFLFLAYLLIEFLEHHAEEKTVEWVNRAGNWGPVIGGVLGVAPQCGFSAATANLYAGGVITRGTVLAVFLSTSDEMLPILISQGAPGSFIVKVLAYKVCCGVVVGVAVDLIEKRHTHAERHLHDLCEEGHCHCENGIFRSALHHSLEIFAFLFIISFLVSLAVETLGTERLAAFIFNRSVLGELLAGLVGLIPNCAASVVITELYLSGGMSAGAMLSGLLVGSGVGVLVLFRMNHARKDTLVTVAILYASGVLLGLLAEFLPIF